MIAAVTARMFDIKALMLCFTFASYLLACCSPLVLVLNGSMLFAARFVAEHAWSELRTRWWIALVFGVVMWAIAALAVPIFLLFLGL